MKRNYGVAIPFALFVVIGHLSAARAATPGAIFTTTADGSVVNANQYPSKCDVYLNGGPGRNAPARAAALPAGDYFFQVTDPSGQTLLSTDAVNNRRFTVSVDGVITGYAGFGGPTHTIGISQDHPELGAVTIRLANASCPTDYLDTSNNGGVYKVWATPVASFAGDPTRVDNACGTGCFHGFVPSASKTDNFKVKPNTSTFCLTVAKQLVDELGAISPGFNWPISVTDAAGVTNNYFTNSTDASLSVCGLVAGVYTVAESPGLYSVVGLSFNGTPISPAQPVYSFSWSSGMPNPVVVFQNLVFQPN